MKKIFEFLFQIADRYPQFKFDDNWTGLIDPMGGIIYANKWLNAFQVFINFQNTSFTNFVVQEEFKKLGGVIEENERVISHTEDSPDSLTVTTSKDQYVTNKIIFTVGCWITKFLPNVNFQIKVSFFWDRFQKNIVMLQPISLSVCYWNAKDKSQHHLLNEDHFPVFISKNLELKEYYFALPDTDYPGAIKVRELFLWSQKNYSACTWWWRRVDWEPRAPGWSLKCKEYNWNSKIV